MNSNGHKKNRILIIDDERDIGLTLQIMLQKFLFSFATSGLDGLSMIQQSHFDLILLDHNLPDIDGLTVLQRIRKSALPLGIVMITGAQDLSLVSKACHHYVDGFVFKPFDLDCLLEVMENVLAKYSRN